MKREMFELGRLEALTPTSSLMCAGFVLVLGIVLWSYRRDVATLHWPMRWLLLFLRLSTWLLLGLIFFEPRLRRETTVEEPSRVAIAVDTSLSMTLPRGEESAGQTTRIEHAKNCLVEGQVLQALVPKHQVSLHGVGKSATLVAEYPRGEQMPADGKFATMSATDDETRLGDSLASILRENRGRPLAAILVLTDGQSNAGASVESATTLAKEAKVPIYAVGTGSPKPPINLRVTDLQLPTRAFKGDELRGRVYVQGSGLSERQVTVEVLSQPAGGDGSPTLLEVMDVALLEDGSPAAIEFKHLPQETGSFEIVVRAPVLAGEIRSDDNAARATFDVVDQKTKVLLLAGGPTREYRFLRNHLYRDSSIDVAVHLQSAGVNSSQEADEPMTKFPASREELFRFDTLVAIDPDWSLLSNESLLLVEEWISRHAAGVVLIAGPVHMPKLARAGLDLPIAGLYPVQLKDVFTSDFEAGRFREPWPVRFSRDGEMASYLRLDEDAAVSKRKWEEFSGVYWCYPIAQLKPAATLLASFGDPRSALGSEGTPLVVRQFYGAGRVLYLGTAELWRLRQLGEAYYDKLWIRVVREMSQGRLLRGSSRAILLLDADRFPIGARPTVRAQVLGSDYQPLRTPILPMAVVDPAGQATNIELRTPVEGKGLYEASLALTAPGEYRLQLLVPDTTEIVERRVTAEIPAREMGDVRLNRAWLEALTSTTGGRVLRAEELRLWAENVEDRTEMATLSGTPLSLWDNGWVLGLAVALACLEWHLRKLHYLA